MKIQFKAMARNVNQHSTGFTIPFPFIGDEVEIGKRYMVSIFAEDKTLIGPFSVTVRKVSNTSSGFTLDRDQDKVDIGQYYHIRMESERE